MVPFPHLFTPLPRIAIITLDNLPNLDLSVTIFVTLLHARHKRCSWARIIHTCMWIPHAHEHTHSRSYTPSRAQYTHPYTPVHIHSSKQYKPDGFFRCPDNFRNTGATLKMFKTYQTPSSPVTPLRNLTYCNDSSCGCVK